MPDGGVDWMYGLPVVKGYGDKTYLVTPELLRSLNPRVTIGDIDISDSVTDYTVIYKIAFNYNLLDFRSSAQGFFKRMVEFSFNPRMARTKRLQPRPRNHHPNRRRKGKRR